MVAFVRRSGIVTGDLFVQEVSAAWEPIGEPRRLSTLGLFYHGLAWSAEGRDVILSSGNRGDIGLWRIPLQRPEQAQRLSSPGDDSRQPAVARQGRLAFTRAAWDENIWRLSLSAPGRAAGLAVSVRGSTRLELRAQFSPDGRRIVFESLRSGRQELWVADADGGNAQQLTSFDGRVGGTPAWSPDGQSIAYDLRDDTGRGDVWVIPARGGSPHKVTNDPADDLVPSWSRNGDWIYFASTRSGTQQVWKVMPEGGRLIKVTQHGGGYAKESHDGRYIYYARTDGTVTALWRALHPAAKRFVLHMSSREVTTLSSRATGSTSSRPHPTLATPSAGSSHR